MAKVVMHNGQPVTVPNRVRDMARQLWRGRRVLVRIVVKRGV